MSAYKWKAKYDVLLLQFERSEKELAATKDEVFQFYRYLISELLHVLALIIKLLNTKIENLIFLMCLCKYCAS